MSKYQVDPDYVEVWERLKKFYETYADGRITTADTPLVVEADGKHYIVVHARAYRAPDDLLPGDGWAWEPVPGTTPFTKNSELMNAQTAAIGRAIVSVGLPASRKIASAEEVRNRKAESNAGPVEVQEREHSALDTLSDKEVAELEPLVREWTARNKKKKPQLLNFMTGTLGVVDVPPKASLPYVLRQIPNAEGAAELLRWMGENDSGKKLTGDELADELIKEGVAVEAA